MIYSVTREVNLIYNGVTFAFEVTKRFITISDNLCLIVFFQDF